MNDEHELKLDLEENLDLAQLQQKVLELQAQVLAAENKAANNWEQLLRAKAEEENLRKRSRIDLENTHKYGIEKLARRMLEVFDSLERGISSVNLADLKNNDNTQATKVAGLKDGMELTLKLLLDNLEQFGIKMVDPIGEPFNPMHHEALSMVEQPEVPANRIIQVVQKGFLIHDRVLRTARVIVAK